MYAIYEFRTNEKGIMTDTLLKKTDNAAYAESEVLKAASSAVTSKVYIHTILCINEHGQPQFGTPKVYEHIEKGDV